MPSMLKSTSPEVVLRFSPEEMETILDAMRLFLGAVVTTPPLHRYSVDQSHEEGLRLVGEPEPARQAEVAAS